MKKHLLITTLAFMSTTAFAAETFTANELCKTFKTNGAAAEKKYKNKRIIVSGRIAMIKEGYKHWSLRLSCNRGSGMRGVPMNVNKSESSYMKRLAKAKGDRESRDFNLRNVWGKKYNKGKNIKFSCEYRRRNKMGVYLKDCRIY